jgi:hypothetical protein
MRRDTETIIIFIGVVYLCFGLSACITPVMFLLAAPTSALSFPHAVIFWGMQILIVGPLFLIGYAWIRRRMWGRYLLIADSGLWFAYLSYAFVVRMIHYSESHLVLAITGCLIPLIVLASLVAFASQEDVKRAMGN